jgi:hypothetical protein
MEGVVKLCIPIYIIYILRNRTGPYLVSQFMARKEAKKHAESKKSKGKSQVASRTEAVTLALRNRIVP